MASINELTGLTVEKSQDFDDNTLTGEVTQKETLPFTVNYYTSGETECTFQLKDDDDGVNYSLFVDFVTLVVDAVKYRDTKKFLQLLQRSPALSVELQEMNRRRKIWHSDSNDDTLSQRVRGNLTKQREKLISLNPSQGKISSVDVLINDKFDPFGELKNTIETKAADTSDTESEASEEMEEGQDISIEDEYPSDEEKEIDKVIQSNPEHPCYFSSQIEMATILKKRIDTIMEYYHNIAKLSDAFDDVDFVVYTARFRMLSNQTEQRICHPDAGVLSKEKLEEQVELKEKKMFMYVRSIETDLHFKQLQQDVKEKPKTLFIIIADECHWGITKDKNQTPSAHNLFINEWCKDNSPRNVVVVQISATPFNLLTQNSRLPEVNCLLLCDKVSTTQNNYEAGDLLVLEREPELEEHVRQTSKEVELHVVHWSEVEFKNFERGMRLKLRSTLITADAPYEYRYLHVSSEGELSVTEERKATDFLVQGSHGIVTIATESKEHLLTLTRDANGRLEAKVEPHQPATFEVKLDFGVGVAAFLCRDENNHYLAVDDKNHVTLQVAKVERKCGVSIMKPKHDVARVSFEFYIDQCVPIELNVVGQQYTSLNYYLSTMNSRNKNDQKIREDAFFQSIVKKAERQKKLSKTDPSSFTIDALLCAEYCYYVLHVSTYDSVDKIRQALTTDTDKSPAAKFGSKLETFITQLKKDKENKKDKEDKEERTYIHHEAFELVRREICDEVKQNFKENVKEFSKTQKHNKSNSKEEELKNKEVLEDSFVSCLMHLSQQDLERITKEKHAMGIVENIKQSLQENDCQKMIEIWKNIVEGDETSSLVKNLIQSGKGESGKMKLVRAKSMKTANQFYHTLRLVRKLSTLEKCFEIIGDYGTTPPIEKQLMKSSSPFFQKLQTQKCQFKFDCTCQELKLQPGRKKCSNCQHVHKSITQYEDLENLACVLILVDKGRMGDTFPQSFDCLDLRLSYAEGSPLSLSTVIQELGRMCRYAKVSVGESHVQNTPYALVGRELFKRLKKSAKDESSPAMSAISCTRVDRYMTKSKSKIQTSSSLRWLHYKAHDDSYDYGNKQTHCNRILLQAEPQIGKTGTYLCLIKQLRRDILGREKVPSTTTALIDEGNFFLFKDSDSFEVPPVKDNNERQDWQFPYWKTIQDSPSLHKKTVGLGKYSIGGCYYTHDMEENPLILMKCEGLKPTKSGHHYQKTNCEDGVRAWHWYHFENCSECGRLLQGKEPVLETVNVNIDGIPVTVKCSVPGNSLSYNNLLQQLTSSTSTGKDWTQFSSYWIFHPSHRDDPRKCLLNYHHVMQKDDHVTNYVQVAVVRSDKFQAYRSTWGKVLAIFQLPDKLHKCKRGPSEGGVGYARRFIQKMAFSLKLEYIFVIDDNVAVMSEAVFSSGEQATPSESVVREENGTMRMQRCSFLKPLTFLQRIVEGKDILPNGGKKYEPHPLKELFEAQQLPLYSYTGPAKLFGETQHDSYGVLGLLRSIPNAVRPFAKTQVYAAVLLNVKSTVENEVFYRPWPCWEDLRFNDDCDEAGLWVVKCNRFLFHKVQYNDWINNLALPSIFQWTEHSKLEKRPLASELPKDFEEYIVLKYLCNLVEGHAKCFKGQIGYDDSQNIDNAGCPTKLLEKLEIMDCTNQALASTVAVLILAYAALDPEMKTLQMLENRYCKAKEKIVFVTSADEASEEWPDMTLTLIQSKRGICVSQDMRNRAAEFAIFSAADPTRHKLRWIVIEASFQRQDLDNQMLSETSDGKRYSDTSSTQQTPESRGYGGVSAKPLESTVSEKRVSKRSVEMSAGDHKENKRLSTTSIWTDIYCDSRESGIQKENEQNREPSFEVNTSSTSKRISETDALEGPTNKRQKVKDWLLNSTTDSTKTPVTPAQCTKVLLTTKKQETPLASQADYMAELPNGRNRKASPEQKKGNASSTVTSSQCADNLAGKGEAQSRPPKDAGDDGGTPSDGQQTSRSPVTGLKPDDPAYDEGTNAVTKSIVALWREKKSLTVKDKDLETERVESELKKFNNKELQQCDAKGYTALTKACSLPSVGLRVVSHLIEKRKVDVNSKLPSNFNRNDTAAKQLSPGMSALSVAIRRGNVRCVSTFMNRKMDIKFLKKDCDGNSPLHHCVLARAKSAFETLFSCIQSWKNEKGKTWKDIRNKKRKNPYETALDERRRLNTEKGKEKEKEALEFMLNRMDPSKQWKNQLESTVSKKRDSERSVDQIAEELEKGKKRLTTSHLTQKDANASANQEMSEQNRGPYLEDRDAMDPSEQGKN